MISKKKYDVNHIILRLIGKMVSSQHPHVPTGFGPDLRSLLRDMKRADIYGFDLTGHKNKGQINLRNWIAYRRKGYKPHGDKLYGFIEYALSRAWDDDIRPDVIDLLDTREANMYEPEQMAIWRETLRLAADPYENYRRGITNRFNDAYGVKLLCHQIDVNEAGDARHIITQCMECLVDEPLELIRPPIFVEFHQDEEQLSPWVEADEGPAKVDVLGWNGRSGAAAIAFRAAKRNISRTIRWGYTTKTLFGLGSSFYRFDLNNPGYVISGSIRFHPSWSVNEVEADAGHIAMKNNTINWIEKYPRAGQKKVRFRVTGVDPPFHKLVVDGDEYVKDFA